MRRERFRIAVVGAGFGRRVMLPALRLDDRFEAVAVCATDAERSRSIAAEEGLEDGGTFAEVARHARLDAVAIAVPPTEQPAVARMAIERGLAVFCEKPLAATLEDARSLCAALPRERPNMIDFEFGEVPSWRRAFELVAAGAIGDVRQISVNWNVRTRASAGSVSWKNDPARGGGALLGFASHTFHAIERFGGKPLAITSAVLPRDSGAADTLVSTTLELANGAYATVRISTDAMCAHEHVVDVFGSVGRLRLANQSADYMRGFTLSLARSADGCRPSVEQVADFPGEVDGRIPAVAGLLGKFADWLASGTPQSPSLAEGLRVQETLDAAGRSSAEQRRIELAEVQS